jgi:signal transduction histidine kinase
VGEAATQLPWLSPCAASLLALARLPAGAAWAELRTDPGAVLLVLRTAARSLATGTLSFFPAVLRQPAVVEGAVQHLQAKGRPSSFVDWNRPELQPVYRASWTYAWLAQRLAELTRRCDPDNAWVGGLLAPLGWQAACAADAEQAADCLADPALLHDPIGTQQRHWGLDQAAIARRLARSWQLPSWLSAVVGHLGLPAEIAQTLGGDPDLFRVVQLAVGLAQQHGHGLFLAVGADPEENASTLGLADAEQKALAADLEETRFLQRTGLEQQTWTPPHEVALLDDLLNLAAESLRLRDWPTLEQLERERDELHQALERLRTSEAERLQALKLQALAEFAAGAAHEINNPLAVISGQAQYLLGHEAEPARQRALQTVITQTQRIHQVLADLMQFARPAQPKPEVVDVRDLVREATLALGDLARQRDVRIEYTELDQAVLLRADPRQIGSALECLLRNALEAAPRGGWARLRLVTRAPDHLELVVEDSGSGPTPGQREHLFDPFYSGRQAGRGRGLGLPTAWRLAREHGGDVYFDGPASGPTRFVLRLPRAPLNGQDGSHRSPVAAPADS